jgi:hypothetical protein
MQFASWIGLQIYTECPSRKGPTFCEVIVSVILSENVYLSIRVSISNCFQDRTISLCSSKIVYKKEILRTVSNAAIYCSSNKVYLA